MGTEALWIPAVMAVLGAGVSAYNTQKTARNTDNALAASIERSADQGRAADKRTGELIDEIGKSTPTDERQTALANYTQALRSGATQATSGLTRGAGKASTRYAQEAADAALGIEDYGANRAGLQSVVDAAQLQRMNEGTRFAAAASDINEIQRRARMAEFLGGLKVQRAGARNPWLDALGGSLSGAAGSMAGGMGTGTPTSYGSGATAEWAGFVPVDNTAGTAFGTMRY